MYIGPIVIIANDNAASASATDLVKHNLGLYKILR